MVELQDSRSKTTTKSKQDLARFKSVLLDLRRSLISLLPIILR